ncbi:MAG: glycosyltransferase family 2 protein [Lachnospiraceae bacterium]|nr:glycosyltransferase family 2 protein [Lachnospiraceae bacterium]
MFTFIVTCYNQADVILFALESIKYQIEKYGKGREFQLIVTDDASEDDSCQVIERWLTENGTLFVKIDRLFQNKNKGICRVYASALRLIDGERFVVLNGDDLLSPYNLFEFTGKLDEYDMVCTAFLKFKGSGEMVRFYRVYLEVVLQNFVKGKALYKSIRLGCPIMGTAVYRKSLLSEEVLDFIVQFRTVNDRACFQKILEKNEHIRICYVNCPIILYRISKNSVSNFNSPNRLLHNREIAQLCKVQKEEEKSLFFRVILLFQEKFAHLRGHSSHFVRLMRFFSPYYVIMLWIYIVHHRKIKKMGNELVDRHWVDCREHYQYIMEKIR